LKNQTKQRGTAIIVALFVTALVAAIAIAMIDQLSTETRRTELLLNNTQANLYAHGSIYWAIDQLTNDYKLRQPNKLIDKTPIKSPVNTVNGAKIFSVIDDAQGKINLNNLNDVSFQLLFLQLIPLVAPHIHSEDAQNITFAVVDWITPGTNDSPFDQYYAKQNPSYRAPHRPMVSISELRMVKGMTADLYTKLLPYVTALPDKTKININSVAIPVLMSFSPTITLETAKALVLFREQTPFTNLDQLGNFVVVKESPIAQNNLTVTSDYFMVQTHVIIGDQHVILHSLLMRLLKNSQPIVNVVWQGTS